MKELLNELLRKDLPEAHFSDGTAKHVEVISPGEPRKRFGILPHRHKFTEVKWDREQHGPDVTNFSEFYATYKSRRRCPCGREEIAAERALI